MQIDKSSKSWKDLKNIYKNMAVELTLEEIKERAKKIEEIGKNFLKELEIFKKKQRELLERYMKELEKVKIEELKKKIK